MVTTDQDCVISMGLIRGYPPFIPAMPIPSFCVSPSPSSLFPPLLFHMLPAHTLVYSLTHSLIHPFAHLSTHPFIQRLTFNPSSMVETSGFRFRLYETYRLFETGLPFCSSTDWERLGSRRVGAVASGQEGHPSRSGNWLCGFSMTCF